jgi:apolipoprotein N-acyltransferase
MANSVKARGGSGTINNFRFNPLKNKGLKSKERLITLLCLVNGLAFGLSAPGIGFWLVAWFGLAPAFVSFALAKGMVQVLLRGFLFGFGYNLVAMHWLLGLAPLDWLGFNGWQGNLLALAALTVASIHQGLIYAVFAFLYKLVPIEATFLPKRKGLWLTWPALFTVPLLWIVVLNKLGNAHDLLGVPWSMIEYSQYQQLPIIQVAEICGGIGIGYLLVFTNTTLALVIARTGGLERARQLTTKGRHGLLVQTGFAAMVLLLVACFGFSRLASPRLKADLNATVLQPNVNIEMQKTTRRYTLDQLLSEQIAMINKAPPGLCVLTESSLPTRLNDDSLVKAVLSAAASRRKLDLIVGAIDQDSEGHAYNAAFGVRADGSIISQAYHKRYLVPFGEYTPIQNMPEWLRRLTNTPAGSGYTAGKLPIVFNLNSGSVSPLICFETISPELAAQSVRAGGQLLVNISDLAWFHRSVIGKQMIACAVFRAIENRRYFIFAANTGPSAIIAPEGTIVEESRLDRQSALIGKVGYSDRLTIFTRCFVF